MKGSTKCTQTKQAKEGYAYKGTKNKRILTERTKFKLKITTKVVYRNTSTKNETWYCTDL